MNTAAKDWQVQIQGRTPDLEHLARQFTALPRRVVRDEHDGGYLYESDAFASCATSQEVLDAASRELSVLSGVLKLVQGSHEPLRCGGVYRQNESGGRDVYLHVNSMILAHTTFREVTLTVTDAQGNIITKPAPPHRTVVLANLASSNPAVAKALRLHAEPDSKSWVGLYRLYEVIEADVGGQVLLAKCGWGTDKQLRRFKHSANSVSVAGDAARHGKEVEEPPKYPMSLDEATAYVEYVLQAWLTHKSG